jgi:rhodanese-related sulfurtransferase
MSSQHSALPWELDVHAVHRLLEAENDLLLLDCREPAEFELVHLDGALLIPMQQIPGRASELEPYRDRRIVVYCHHGGRSMLVTRWLRKQGFTGAQNMAGGIDAWSCSIDPAKPRYE